MHSPTETVSIWPKVPPRLTNEQQMAREKFMYLWHKELPNKYSLIERFNQRYVAKLPVPNACRTLEVGAGIGGHLPFEDLSKQEYHCLEYREEFCRELGKNHQLASVVCGDIQKRQSWPDQYFDRIVAIHVLEHLCDLPSALAELHRLLKINGMLDLVLPCEGGFAYSMARAVSARRLFEREFGMDYTPIIQNEHVSTLSEILAELKKTFRIQRRSFFPFFPIPSSEINLCVGLRLLKHSQGK